MSGDTHRRRVPIGSRADLVTMERTAATKQGDQMFRRHNDPEVQRERRELRGHFNETGVTLIDVPVVRRRSGRRHLADPDATISWLAAAEQIEVRRRPRGQPAPCDRCGTSLPPEPIDLDPVRVAVSPDAAGSAIIVTTRAWRCDDCGTTHVRRIRQFTSDVADAIIDALESAEVTRS